MRNDFSKNQVVDLRRPLGKIPDESKVAFLKEYFRRFRFSLKFWLVLICALIFISTLFLFLKGYFPFSIQRSNQNIYQLPQKAIPRGLNLVFYADGYESWDEFNSDVDSLTRNIKKVEPWKAYERFNIYRINPGKEADFCRVKTENERKPVLRCEEKINRYFEQLELSRAKFIVLSRKDFQSWANVSRLQDSGVFFSLPQKLEPATEVPHSYLMLHLLGHAFGLKDEEKFVIAKAEGEPHEPNGPNCAPDKETAEKWWGDLAKSRSDRVGYFKTCAGSEDYVRPTESSLMNLADLEKFVPDYGPVSERYLRKILDYCFSESKTGYESDSDFFKQYPELKKCLE